MVLRSGGTWTVHRLPGTFRDDSIEQIVGDAVDNVWATVGGVLFRFDGTGWRNTGIRAVSPALAADAGRGVFFMRPQQARIGQGLFWTDGTRTAELRTPPYTDPAFGITQTDHIASWNGRIFVVADRPSTKGTTSYVQERLPDGSWRQRESVGGSNENYGHFEEPVGFWMIGSDGRLYRSSTRYHYAGLTNSTTHSLVCQGWAGCSGRVAVGFPGVATAATELSDGRTILLGRTVTGGDSAGGFSFSPDTYWLMNADGTYTTVPVLGAPASSLTFDSGANQVWAVSSGKLQVLHTENRRAHPRRSKGERRTPEPAARPDPHAVAAAS